MPRRPAPLPLRLLLATASALAVASLGLLGSTCNRPQAQFEDVSPLGAVEAVAPMAALPPDVLVPNVVASCPLPTPGGPIDSASVPVGERNDLRVILSAPAPPGGTLVQLTSQDPSIATAGDPRQGFSTTVFVPAGGQVSNSFDIYGIEVGLTQITGQDLTSNFTVLSLPIVVWDLGEGGGLRLIDANAPPENNCRNVDTSPNLSQDPNKLATCGTPVRGVSADGVSPLLLRTHAGLTGTFCFDVIPPTAQDPGHLTDTVVTSQLVGSDNQATSFYVAPADYDDPTPLRTVDLEAVFIPATGNPSPTFLTTRVDIVAPPVVAIHGVWSDREGWNTFYNDRNTALRTVYLADYADTNQREFANNVPRVRGFIDKALDVHRQKGFAATRADIIAHSMGGILTRQHVLDPAYPAPDTFGQGDVNKVVMLTSPQYGSNLANALVRLYSIAPNKSTLIGTALGSRTDALVGGSVCDLAENSPAFSASVATTLPVSLVTATGAPPGTPTIGAQLPTTLEVALSYILDAFEFSVLDLYRFRERNDGIVPLSSQQAGTPASAQLDFNGLTHATIDLPGVTSSAAAAMHAFGVLSRPASDPAYVSVLPQVPTTGFGGPLTVPGNPPGLPTDQATYLAQCGAGGPMRASGDPGPSAALLPASTGLAAITSPAPGASFAPGATVNVTTSLDPGFTATQAVASVGRRLESFTPPSAGTDFQVTIPLDLAGDVPLSVSFFDATGAEESDEITIHVQPAAAPVSLRVPAAHALAFPPAPGGEERLSVQGVYADGAVRDLRDPSTGTTYTSLDPSIAGVGADGVLSAVGAGITSVRIDHAGLQAFTTVLVGSPVSTALPTASVSAQMQLVRSGIRLDRTTGFFVQDVQVTNAGTEPALGPLWLVVSNLTPDVDWVDPDAFSEVSDPGAPAGRLALADGLALAPGETSARTLRFLNPNRSAIDYQIDVVQGPRP